MGVRWSGIVVGLAAAALVAGCQHGRDRKLRHDLVEEYPVPAQGDRVCEPPSYPDQKRSLPSPTKPAGPMGPSMGAPGPGGPGGPAGGAGGRPF